MKTRVAGRKVCCGLLLLGWAVAWAVADPQDAARSWAPHAAANSTVETILRLSAAEASEKLPVTFEAVVTYFRPYDHILFVADGTAAMYVNAPADAKLAPGDRVRVSGTTHESFRNYVAASGVAVIGHGALPPAAEASYDAMIHGEVDCRRVRARALVRSAEIVPTSVLLVPATALRLLIDGHQVEAEVGGSDGPELEKLLDAEVEITGVVSGHFDNKMQQTGVLFHVQSLDDVRILQRAKVDPWSVPVTPMDRVINGYSMIDRTKRTRVHGVITYSLPGSGAVLQDGSRSLWVTTDSFQPLRVGDLADATGFPDVKDGFLSLTRSEVRDSAIPAPVTAPLYRWRALAEGGNSSHGHLYDLVSIEGKVVAAVRQESQDEYLLSTDGHLTSAIFRHPGSLTRAALPEMRQVPVGSIVRVTGICMLDNADPFLGDVPFDLLLRSFADITVVAPPPWLTVPHLLLLLALLMGGMFALVARSWQIERRVRHQTASMAGNERRRRRILEGMNANEPLEKILGQICELVTFQINGGPCWCEMEDGSSAGTEPEGTLRRGGAEECRVTGASGSALGTIYARQGGSGRGTREVLARAAGLMSLAVERSQLHADLLHRSEFDLLTEIHNRFSMEKRLDAMIGAAGESHAVFGLIYVDLDDFKGVNDRYGHGVGDQYLQQAALRLRRQLRPSDMLARLGGDEFAMLVAQVQGRGELEPIAQRLKRCFEEPFAIGGARIRGEASIGFALYPEDGTSRDGLLNAADAAMYKQKRAGKVMKTACSG
ncbi:MAG TPA: GGDEF domain-containing protein [Acidobacteriaceae bacterium]